MSMNPVTVLLCVHSPAPAWDALLCRALDSLRAQTHKAFDTVLVLDECQERTVQAVQAHLPPNTRVLRKPTPKAGLAYAKNYGLEHIRTPWVAALDADDQYLPRKLEAQLEWIKQQPRVDILGTQSQVVLDGVPQSGSWPTRHPLVKAMTVNNAHTTHDAIARAFTKKDRNVLTHGSVMIRRSVLEALGGYHHVKGAEDYDLWKRALQAGYQFAVVPEPLYLWSYGTAVPR